MLLFCIFPNIALTKSPFVLGYSSVPTTTLYYQLRIEESISTWWMDQERWCPVGRTREAAWRSPATQLHPFILFFPLGSMTWKQSAVSLHTVWISQHLPLRPHGSLERTQRPPHHPLKSVTQYQTSAPVPAPVEPPVSAEPSQEPPDEPSAEFSLQQSASLAPSQVPFIHDNYRAVLYPMD